MERRMLVLSIGFLLDILFGDPYWLYHPVRGIGWMISGMEKVLFHCFRIYPEREKEQKKKQVAGFFLVVFILLFSVGLPFLILKAAGRYCPGLAFGLECFWCYQLLAMKSLKKESMKVYAALVEGDIKAAREAVSMIVGRDTANLTEEGITKAAIETVAENTSDGVIAPMLFILFFGVLGGFFYKAANTMDSMVGYKNDKYYDFGKCAAKLDDILNFIPARVSAACMAAASFFCRLDWKNVVRIFKRDRYCHASPNSGQTEAVCAGALNIQLAGDAYYFGKLCHKPVIGDNKRKPEAEDIRLANRLLYGTAILAWGIGILFFLR